MTDIKPMFVLEFVAAAAAAGDSNSHTHTHRQSHSPVAAACSPVRAEIEEGKSTVRAISAADNKRRRDAGGAKSASLSLSLYSMYVCLPAYLCVCAFYIIQFWAFSARQVCYALLIRSVVAPLTQGASAIRCNANSNNNNLNSFR